MSRLSSLIYLINSLSKAEKKKISTIISPNDNDSDYSILYKIISNNQNINTQKVKAEFQKIRPKSAFNTSVNYLFDTLLTILNQLRINLDSYYTLFNMLMNAKLLYEKSIYSECFQLLTKIQTDALYYENYSILFIAQKMELDYLLSLNFPNITEKELLNKQFKVNDTIKKIRKLNEHASLYELLKYRILHKGPVRSQTQKKDLNDLVVSEMSIVSSSGFQNFEIQKNHKLFQSNYLVNVGDYKSALNSYYELNNVFEQNMHLLSNPPMYYLDTIEGVLKTLRSIHNYDEMTYFIDKLNNLESSSVSFKLRIDSVVFLYKLLPFIDKWDFKGAQTIVNSHKESIIDKINFLNPDKQIQIQLYISIIHFGLKEYSKARKITTQIMQSERQIFQLAAYRTVRLIHLMVLYEQKEFDYIEFEIRSIKREIKNNDKIFKLEQLVLSIISKTPDELNQAQRLHLWNKTEPKLHEIRNDKFELQLIHIFDFTKWIEKKLTP